MTQLETLAKELGKKEKSDADETEGSGESTKDAPLTIVIDELDRCKPTFALNLIERIKHFYEVEGVCFLMVTNLDQIKSAICSAYGADTKAHTYLEKFYQLRISLPEPE